MCGIIGAAGNVDFKIEKVVKDMLRFDVVRGPHSTGLAAVTTQNEVLIAKKAMLPEDLLETRESKEIFKKVCKAIIGHNRWATQGAINSVNAHPFEVDDLVGVHNGTVLKHRLPDGHKFDVDSEAAYNAISKLGVQEAHNKMDGKFTFVWWDIKEKRLKFLRNKDRPLYMAFTEKDDAVIWASEAWMILAACGRQGVPIKDVIEVEVGNLYTFDVFGNVNQFTKEKLKLETFHTPTTQSRVTSITKGAVIPFCSELKIGDPSVFEVVKIVYNGSQCYAEGEDMETGHTVRCYLPHHKSALKAEMNYSTDYFVGDIQGHVGQNSSNPRPYLLINPNTVNSYCTTSGGVKEESGKKSYQSGGREVKLEEFNDTRYTVPNCQWCDDPLKFKEEPKFIGIIDGKSGYVCKHCESLPDVSHYLDF